MCKLCDNKLDYAKIEEGWLYLEDESMPKAVITFPCHYCPWCGEDMSGDERMMPKITPREWKEQMREQEAENEN